MSGFFAGTCWVGMWAFRALGGFRMIGRTSGSWLRVLAAMVLVGICAGATRTAHAEEDKTAQIEKAFREGVDLYQQGRYAEAQRKLKEVLSLDPRKELAARLVD